MSRKLALAAVMATTGLFAIGCGAPPSTGGSAKDPAMDPAKRAKELAAQKEAELKHMGADAKKKLDEAKDAAGDLANKLKEAAEGYGKEVGVLDKALAALTKAKTDEKDAAKAAPLAKVESEATGLLTELKKKIGELAGLKDAATLDTAKKAITDLVEKLKALLKDYLPK